MNLKRSLLWLLVATPVLFVSSCEKLHETDQEGRLEIGVAMDQLTMQLKSANTDSTAMEPTFVVLSVANENGEPVLDNEHLELYNFGGSWVTKEVKLGTGNYELTRFMVIDMEGNVIMAAPLEGSALAYLVDDPLPVSFTIHPNQTTRVVPEVLAVIGQSPTDFGYASFSINVVNTLNFFVAVFIDDPRIMAPTTITSAKLTVIIGDEWRHAFYLEPKVNELRVRDSWMEYTLVVAKEGYESVTLITNRERLLQTSPDNPLMIGIPVNNLNVLVLQPGPDEGKDAMISMSMPGMNYGKYEYFEATASSPETDFTEHKLTRSLIEFDLNRLPKSATIKRAVLTLYYPYNMYVDSVWPVEPDTWVASDPNTGDIWPDEYLAVLQKVVSPWEEHGVTWKNQPETTTEGQVFIPRIYYIMDAACDCFLPPVSESFDVTSLLMPGPDGTLSHGMMLKLFNEQSYEWLQFASSDFDFPWVSNADMQPWPKLEIYYSLPLD